MMIIMQPIICKQAGPGGGLCSSDGSLRFYTSGSVSRCQYTQRARRYVITLASVIVIASSLSCAASPQGDALLDMAKSWNANFSTWIPGSNHCQNWVGVTCNTSGDIVALNLTNKGLLGPIPAAISNLTSLVSLDLSNIDGGPGPWNHVRGDLLALAPLTNLQILNITFNVLGPHQGFPKVVLTLENLVALRMDNAQLMGPFPTNISMLQKLQYLSLGNNSMTGPMPRELGPLEDLVELALWLNNFDSEISPAICNLRNLTLLDLHDCNLWGGLLPEMGKLKNLQRISLYRNNLTGPIPEAWQSMVGLTELSLQGNFLFGQVQPWTLQLPNIRDLVLSSNQFYGDSSFANSSVQTLKVDCNYISGGIPTNLQLNTNWSFDNNCLNGKYNRNDNLCNSKTSCVDFLKQTQNGTACPSCPSFQTLLDSTSCICMEEIPRPKHHFRIAVLAAVGVTVALVAGISLFLLWRWKRRTATTTGIDFFSNQEVVLGTSWEAPKGVRQYSLQELSKATGGFDKAHEIGSGGFGRVFCGRFDDGRTLAIKRASCHVSSSVSSAHGQSQFRNEVALLSRLHHKNLVRLEGFCDESGFQILVYELMVNGNLHSHLFRKGYSQYLDWYKRLDIAVGVAQGLEYLHSFANPPVIHRDVKPSNILLDHLLMAKVADFGISKVSPEFDTHVSTKPAGTAGYFDPQYFIRQQLTTASDVYSFGVVLLELVTGQKAIDHTREEEYNLMEWAKPRLEAGRLQDIVDPKLGYNYPRETFAAMAELAIKCTDFDKMYRPSMKTVLSILEPHLQSAQPPLYVRTLSSLESVDTQVGKLEDLLNDSITNDILPPFTRLKMVTDMSPR